MRLTIIFDVVFIVLSRIIRTIFNNGFPVSATIRLIYVVRKIYFFKL